MSVLWRNSLLLMCSVMLALPAFALSEEKMAQLQRGSQVFMNYCSGCHSLKYLRYSQMAKALGLTSFDGQIDRPLLYSNLVFTNAALHDPIHIALQPEDALRWFGAVPPDLSLLVRQRGANWLRAYLNGFYRDPARPFGSNNLVSPRVAMPNVLEILSGERVMSPDGHIRVQSAGRMTPTEFDALVTDVTAFLSYVSTPEKAFRQRMGYVVLAFLGLLTGVLYLWKREIWIGLAKSIQSNS